MIYNRFPLIFAAFLLLGVACVKPKVYRAELAARNQAEAREKMLLRELAERKDEADKLIRQVGELNRTIGAQTEELGDLRTELSTRTQQMGESSSKLAEKLAQTQNELANRDQLLQQRTATVQKIQNTQKERRRRLDDIHAALQKAYPATSGVQVELVADEAVALTLPDKGLFNADGLTVSAAGKTLLKPLADLLAERPELDADIAAYTDNSLPKDKTVKDTWDWSLLRATNVVRLLIRDYNTNANQLTPVGRGEFYPLTSNATPEGRLANRRTVALIRPVLPAVPPAE